jgi:hypothetical protein
MTNLRTIRAGLLTALVLAPAVANAAVIFDNFGAGNHYISCCAWIIGDQEGWVQGDGFVVPGTGNYRLDQIELAASLYSGPNMLDVTLYDTVNGLPGTALETFHFTDVMGPYTSYPNPLLVSPSILHPLLAAQSQYWLIASVPDPTSVALWAWNDVSDWGPRAQSHYGSPFWGSDYWRGASRVTASQVPEPTTLLLLGSGLTALMLYRRRRTP